MQLIRLFGLMVLRYHTYADQVHDAHLRVGSSTSLHIQDRRYYVVNMEQAHSLSPYLKTEGILST